MKGATTHLSGICGQSSSSRECVVRGNRVYTSASVRAQLPVRSDVCPHQPHHHPHHPPQQPTSSTAGGVSRACRPPAPAPAPPHAPLLYRMGAASMGLRRILNHRQHVVLRSLDHRQHVLWSLLRSLDHRQHVELGSRGHWVALLLIRCVHYGHDEAACLGPRVDLQAIPTLSHHLLKEAHLQVKTYPESVTMAS